MTPNALSFLLEKRIKIARYGCERVFKEFPKEWGGREVRILFEIMAKNPPWNTKRVISEIRKTVDNSVDKVCSTCGSYVYCVEEDENLDISRARSCHGFKKEVFIIREPRVKFEEEG